MDCGPGSLTDASGSESRVIGSAVFQGQSLLKKHTHTIPRESSCTKTRKNKTMVQKECLERSRMIFQATLLPTCGNISGYFHEELDKDSVAGGREKIGRYWTHVTAL